ncbi:MAG TPA: hypothetical protein EYN91_20575 [Candidatus Melainabacteria bacterium]|nr:hypothetical protein [Candidatus Melainabacteria bacterium]HIN63652.1 hypothetical protein [Candidatus Obscuribacterales bacterium]
MAEPGHDEFTLIYLGDVVGFRKQNRDKYDIRRNVFEDILFCRWQPNLDERFNLAWLSGEGSLKIPSISSAFNWNASNAFRSAQLDFPELDWDASYLFAAERDGKYVQRVGDGCVARTPNFVRGSMAISVDDERHIAASYVKKYWTPERIKSYCKPTTDRPSFMRRELISAGRMNTGKFILLPEHIEVNWDAEISNGKGLFYTVWAERGKSFWLLQNDKSDAVDQNDDTFLLRRISDAVFLSIKKFELVNADALISQLRSNRRKSNSPEERLVRDMDQSPVGYTCILSDGKKLMASLDRNGSIVSITVNGKPDETWTSAITNVQRSNDFLSQYDATGSFVSPQRRGKKHVR